MKEDEFESLSYPFERLSKLQHYGIPTRLIDVTIDPLIALFFAVENIEDKSDSLVYVYIQNSHKIDSKQVRLLSLLGFLKDYNFDTIQKEYQKHYNDIISIEEILTLSQNTSFVEFKNTLKNSNSRLFNQKGTFAICGNKIVDGEIQRDLNTLDNINPDMILRIPYEHKLSVKHELDEKYGINQTLIYPELPSVACYIREKYKSENFSIDGTYSIIEKQNISIIGAKRISIIIVLTKTLRIDQIKQITINVVEEYNSENDVIWVYIAKNGDDYIMSNWILRVQWISPVINPNFRPLPIGVTENDEYFWDEGSSYSTLADYYSEHVFEDDKTLYASHHEIYEKIRPLFDLLYTTLQKNYDDFIIEVNIQKGIINQSYIKLGDFGHSRNKEFDDFLHNYHLVVAQLDNISLWVNNDGLNTKAKIYQITSCFKEAKKYIDIIDRDSSEWRKNLNITK